MAPYAISVWVSAAGGVSPDLIGGGATQIDRRLLPPLRVNGPRYTIREVAWCYRRGGYLYYGDVFGELAYSMDTRPPEQCRPRAIREAILEYYIGRR